MFKKTLSLTLAMSFMAVSAFTFVNNFTPVAIAATDTVDVNLTVTEEIAVTIAPDPVNLTALSTSVNSSFDGTTVTVTTNATAGYTLAVNADTDPALQSAADSFANYTEAVTGTPEDWASPSSAYEFGFGAYGTDADTGEGFTVSGTCGSGASAGTAKYMGFSATAQQQIATATAPTATTGSDTELCFGAEQAGVFAPSGTYNATVTATALAL